MTVDEFAGEREYEEWECLGLIFGLYHSERIEQKNKQQQSQRWAERQYSSIRYVKEAEKFKEKLKSQMVHEVFKEKVQ